jgi:proline iminopeptidase
VFGGSWGSTLGLAYADAHPEAVRGMVLYGIFLTREKEFQSMFKPDGAAALMYPEYYEAFIEQLPPEDRDHPIDGYHKLFDSDDAKRRQNALRAWSHWEMRLLTLVPDEEMFLPENEDMEFLTTHSLFERHYYEQNGFMDGDALLTRIGDKIKGKPLHIVHGRYDLVCLAQTAYELHKVVPQSTLTYTIAGHSAKDPETLKVLMDRVKLLT